MLLPVQLIHIVYVASRNGRVEIIPNDQGRAWAILQSFEMFAKWLSIFDGFRKSWIHRIHNQGESMRKRCPNHSKLLRKFFWRRQQNHAILRRIYRRRTAYRRGCQEPGRDSWVRSPVTKEKITIIKKAYCGLWGKQVYDGLCRSMQYTTLYECVCIYMISHYTYGDVLGSFSLTKT